MEEDAATDIVSVQEETTTEHENAKEQIKEYVLSKTLRLVLNLITHVLMIITVFVCLVYACKAGVGIYELHIILCVVGYQFFMCQGALALAKFNAWSVYLKRLHRIHVHWVLEFIAVASVTAGSVLYILELPSHLNTLHGGFGLVALAAAGIGFFGGTITGVSYTIKACTGARRWFKYIHHAISVIALLSSSISLCFAYTNPSFEQWTSRWFENDELPVPILMFITMLFTALVAFEFLIGIIWI